MSLKDRYVLVIGGANTDIGGRPYAPLVSGDSNPGRIVIGCGGVGRNIAEALAKLDIPVKLVTAIGDDYMGNYIRDHCEAAGIDMSHSLTVPGEPSSMYLYINEYDGDMSVALSHMDIMSYITPEYIDSISDVIKGASAVVIDCNVTQETFIHVKNICNSENTDHENFEKYFNEKIKIPLYTDPVSTAHAQKIKGHLEGIDTLKPNKLEAEFLTDMTINSDDDFRKAAYELIRQGVRRVFISMGEGGVMAADKDACHIVEGFPAKVLNTTGAGDSATAAIVWASLTRAAFAETPDGLIFAAKAANAAASIAVASAHTIDPDLSTEKLINLITMHHKNQKLLS